MPAAVFADIAKQVISILNAQVTTTAYPASATDIGDTRRNSGEIKEAIVEADLEARVAICETLGNGFRVNFVAPTAALTPLSGNPQAAELPERIGPVSRVEIQIASADTTWVAGEQCPLSEIREIIANPGSVFGVAHNVANSPTGGFYFIDEAADLITWTGNAVRVYVATIGAIDRTTPALLTPDAYSPYLVARAVQKCWKIGDPGELQSHYGKQAAEMMSLITKGSMVLPQLEPIAQRAA